MRLTRDLSPPEHDRAMQVHLAQARGPQRNGDLLRAAVRRAVDQLQGRDGAGGGPHPYPSGSRLGRPQLLGRERGTSAGPQTATGLEMRAGPAMPAGQEMGVGDDPLIETLEVVAGMLEDAGIPYAITGSIASSVHGEPFSSVDVDVMVLASAGQAAAMAPRLTPRFYASAEALAEAADRGAIANVVDNLTGMKVDLSFPGRDAFLLRTLDRRVKLRIGSHAREFWFVTAEDVILMKLLWRKDTRSAKQWENAASVARVKGARMDWRYLFEQARALGIENDLVKLRDEAGI